MPAESHDVFSIAGRPDAKLGTMARRMRDFDFAQTPLGPAVQWPESLLFAVRTLLGSHHAMWMAWGPELTFLYNDACSPILGPRESWALGTPASTVWAENWSEIRPRIDQVMTTGDATWDEGRQLFIERHGYTEETFHTFSYSPLTNESGQIQGMLCVVSEESKRLIGSRRMATLRDLAGRLGRPRSEAALRQAAQAALPLASADLPLVLLYARKGTANQANLLASVGTPSGGRLAPLSLSLSPESAGETVSADHGPVPWPVGTVMRQGELLQLNDMGRLTASISCPPFGQPPQTVLLLPLHGTAEHAAGVLIAGLSPYRTYDAEYRSFVELYAGQLAASLSNAQADKQERQHTQALAEVEPAKSRGEAASPAGRAHATTAAQQVLVVADSPDMREYMVHLLAPHYTVMTAEDGRTAIELSRNLPPALILCDVMTPQLDGFELLQTLRRDPALVSIPVLLTSARAGEDAVLEGLEAGPDDYLVKPFSARELLVRVQALLERTAFEQRLAHSEARLTAALDTAKIAVFDWKPSSDALALAGPATVILGLHGNDHLSSRSQVVQLIHPEDKEDYEAVVAEALLKRSSLHHEYRIIRPCDGQLAWIEERSQVLESPLPDSPRVTGLWIDITERKQADIELRRIQDWTSFLVRFDTTLRSADSPDQLCRLATELLGKRLQCARLLYIECETDMSHCQVLGQYSPLLPPLPEQLPKDDYDSHGKAAITNQRPYVVTDTALAAVDPKLQAHWRGQQVRSLAIVPIGKEARLVGVMLAQKTVPHDWSADELNELQQIGVRCREAADYAATSRALQESEERLAISVEAGQLGTFYCPMPLGELLWNDICKAHFWLPPDAEVDIELFYSIIHEKDRDLVREAVSKAVGEGDPYDIEYRTVAPDGRWRWLRAIGRAYSNAAGEVSRFDGVTLDITKVKLIESQREYALAAERAAREEAERVNRMKDEFLATLSHELRTPLNAILGWSQILREDPEDQAATLQGLEAIERNARAQTRLIEELLDMSRIISGKIRLDVQEVLPTELVEQAVQALQPMAEGRGVQLLTTTPSHVGIIQGDPSRLQQTLWNLVTNGIKFTPKGGQVRVTLRASESHVEFEVKDSGEGIDPAFLPLIFGRFQQADASTTRYYGGLGLGLSIVKQLVELHGGAVKAHSQGLGQGSTFTIQLPRGAFVNAEVDESAPLHISEPPRPPPMRKRGDDSLDLRELTILVVDDVQDARDVLRRILSGRGARVVTAASAAEALTMIQTERPALLISDIGMPLVDGYELIRNIRGSSAEPIRSIPALALTAFARAEDRVKALQAGYQIHLTKPVNPAELIHACLALCGRVT